MSNEVKINENELEGVVGGTGSWQQYACSVDYIEEITGYDFFELLPDDIEEEIESKVMSW